MKAHLLVSVILSAFIVGCIPAPKQVLVTPEAPEPPNNLSGYVTTDAGVSSNANAVIVQPSGDIVIAGLAGSSDLLLARYKINGLLDDTFDGDSGTGDGIVKVDLGSFLETITDMIQQGDGKLVVSGYYYNGANYDFLIARFNSNGTLDTAFGTNGITITNFGFGNDMANSIIQQADGKYLVAGSAYNSINRKEFAIARYKSDGTLDADIDAYTGFSVDGKLSVPLQNGHNAAFAILQQADGKIIAAGESQITGGPYTVDVGLIRVDEFGNLDSTFSGDGIVVTHLNSGNNSAKSIVQLPDDKLVIAGETYNGSDQDMLLIRYNTNGSVDDTFDGDSGTANGVIKLYYGVTATYNESFNDMIIDSSGKLAISGQATSEDSFYADFVIARFNTDGTADTTFNFNGFKLLQVYSGYNDIPFAITQQSDGKYILAGAGNQDAGDLVSVARFNIDGSLDTTFGF
jgi:uncharacterized delta-60 repeat protein